MRRKNKKGNFFSLNLHIAIFAQNIVIILLIFTISEKGKKAKQKIPEIR